MSEVFTSSVEIAAPVAVVWGFHERADALGRLTPPWVRAELVSAPEPGLQAGKRVVLRQRIGPLAVTLTAVHVACEEGRMFADQMSGGPFAAWLHRHVFEPTATGCRMTDEVTYTLRGGALGHAVAGWYARRELARLFAYRHEVTKRACEDAVRRAGPA